MPRPTSYPTLFDECRTISIRDLKLLGYLEPNICKSGQITWSYQGQTRSSIGITVNTNEPQPYLALQYTLNGQEQINYKVNLFQLPSNLGKGFVWFFKCPKTNKPCRKLYLSNGYFLHRAAIGGAMYESQTQSKNGRSLSKYFKTENGFFAYLDQIDQKHFKKYYNGKPTKKFKKLVLAIERAKLQKPIDFKKMLFNKG